MLPTVPDVGSDGKVTSRALVGTAKNTETATAIIKAIATSFYFAYQSFL